MRTSDGAFWLLSCDWWLGLPGRPGEIETIQRLEGFACSYSQWAKYTFRE